ncbi:MAG: FAD/NAD(P)-binding:oxidoreductase [uncultured Sulfurovum sp.]|uniref:FAD/NAD(P)-binding:oxidoreductase n=1 Tax=uncultured Sulfurovum sp. TaxID=269237 RepID=A0A6S6SNX7_9BACT|nr:MAG: FAD/NAD(P)-binding:oxidoreductase [uncultured Sulfurovum sp.]
MMETTLKQQTLFMGLLSFIGVPLLLWAVGEYPVRSILKESLSVLTLFAFFMMTAQFFLSHANSMMRLYHFKEVLKWHKIIGYTFILVFIFHPLFIVVPRFFESGLLPMDAFLKLITTFETTGQIMGLVAYILMFVLGATSIFRNKMGMSYKKWKLLHGIFSLLFIGFATYHAIDMGRHAEKAMAIWMILLAVTGSILLLKTYLSPKETHHEAR